MEWGLRVTRFDDVFSAREAAADMGISVRAAAGMLRRLRSAGKVRVVAVELGHSLYEFTDEENPPQGAGSPPHVQDHRGARQNRGSGQYGEYAPNESDCTTSGPHPLVSYGDFTALVDRAVRAGRG